MAGTGRSRLQHGVTSGGTTGIWTGPAPAPTPGNMTETAPFDVQIDARGLLCPLPVLKARKRLLAMPRGQVLRLLATDPAAVVDVPHFCQQAGHDLLGTEDLADATAYVIRRG